MKRAGRNCGSHGVLSLPTLVLLSGLACGGLSGSVAGGGFSLYCNYCGTTCE